MPTAQAIHDQAVRHRVGLSRYSNTLVRQVIALLNRTDLDVVARLASGDFGDRKHSQSELESLLTEIRVMQAHGWHAIGEHVDEAVNGLTGAEVDFQQRLMQGAAASVQVELQSMRLTVGQVVAAVRARPFEGRFLKEWLAETEAGAARRVRDAIRMGWVEGQSIPDIVRRIRGTRAAKYRDGILETSRRSAETMVRTAVTHVSSVAAQQIYEDAGPVVVGVEWVATLDLRTSVICASLDGQLFPVDKGPRPPAHPNCRSTTIPRLKNMDPFERTSFDGWLTGQPTEVQDEVLGPSRARLWRSGGLKLDRFTDDAGELLTLDELRARDAAAFDKAGL
jgi:SPP1 gp7 family putative phage head morphogenesis protein